MGRWTHTGGEAKAPAFLCGCLTVTQNKQGRAAGAPVPGQRGGCGWPSRGRLLRGKQEAQHTDPGGKKGGCFVPLEMV